MARGLQRVRTRSLYVRGWWQKVNIFLPGCLTRPYSSSMIASPFGIRKMNTTVVNPASSRRIVMRVARRMVRRAWFHVRAMVLGFEIRHALPIT